MTNLHQIYRCNPSEVLPFLDGVDITGGNYTEQEVFCNLRIYTLFPEYAINNNAFVDCAFDNDGLSGAKYRNCTFTNCQFGLFRRQCTVFENCTFTNCIFWDNESGIDYNQPKIYFEGCTFEGGLELLSDCYAINSHWPIPKEGPFKIYKKVRVGYVNESGYNQTKATTAGSIGIVELFVPAEAQRHFDYFTKKIRVSEALVTDISVANSYERGSLEISNEYPQWRELLPDEVAFSIRENNFSYAEGQTVRPLQPFDTQHKTCAAGIHGFATIEEANVYGHA